MSGPQYFKISGRLFSNIIQNAVEATGKLGEIWFDSKDLTFKEEAFVQIKIGNKGPQVEEDDLARLFEPFFTLGKKIGKAGLQAEMETLFRSTSEKSIEYLNIHLQNTRHKSSRFCMVFLCVFSALGIFVLSVFIYKRVANQRNLSQNFGCFRFVIR